MMTSDPQLVPHLLPLHSSGDAQAGALVANSKGGYKTFEYLQEANQTII
jgi:hypothetical protein